MGSNSNVCNHNSIKIIFSFDARTCKYLQTWLQTTDKIAGGHPNKTTFLHSRLSKSEYNRQTHNKF